MQTKVVLLRSIFKYIERGGILSKRQDKIEGSIAHDQKKRCEESPLKEGAVWQYWLEKVGRGRALNKDSGELLLKRRKIHGELENYQDLYKNHFSTIISQKRFCLRHYIILSHEYRIYIIMIIGSAISLIGKLPTRPSLHSQFLFTSRKARGIKLNQKCYVEASSSE